MRKITPGRFPDCLDAARLVGAAMLARLSRTITLSTAVFAAIWGKRRDGEETEDTILLPLARMRRRRSGRRRPRRPRGRRPRCPKQRAFPGGLSRFSAPTSAGSTRRPPGQASGCARTRGRRYPTLNRLNESIASGNENVWNGSWKYRTPTNHSGPSTRCVGRMERNMQRPFGSASVPSCGHAHSLPSSQAS